MGYWDSIIWIAKNDWPTDRHRPLMERYSSVKIVAAIFGKEIAEVAYDVWAYRTGGRNFYTQKRDKENDANV